MRFAVMGAGGIGGYYGGRLAAAGYPVGFIARGRHLAALRRNGLRVLSESAGDRHVAPVTASDDPREIGPVDAVLFTVKAYDTEAAAELCRPLLHDDTAVATLQNGVDSVPALSRLLGRRHVIGGVANISAFIEAPGVIRHHGVVQILRFGELDNRVTLRLRRLHAACAAAGIETHIVDDVERELWVKFIFLAALAGANCLTRQPLGTVRADPALRAVLAGLIEESIAVGRAHGVALPEDQPARTLATLDGLPAAMKASTLVALERGERLEADTLSGAVLRLGAEAGIATPFHAAAYAAMRPYIDGRPAA